MFQSDPRFSYQPTFQPTLGYQPTFQPTVSLFSFHADKWHYHFHQKPLSRDSAICRRGTKTGSKN
jgi:hypothetical protein